MESEVDVTVKWGKHSIAVRIPANSTVRHLKDTMFDKTNVLPVNQKFSFQKRGVTDDTRLCELGVKGRTVMMMGTAESQLRSPMRPVDRTIKKEVPPSPLEQISRITSVVDTWHETLKTVYTQAETATPANVPQVEKKAMEVSERLMQQLLALDAIELPESPSSSSDTRAIRKAQINRINGLLSEVDAFHSRLTSLASPQDTSVSRQDTSGW
jgi:hypothetical protein